MLNIIRNSIIKFFLFVLPIHIIYVYLKNFLYDKNLISPIKVESKIICIGNISLGGSGKTPLTISVASFLKKKGFSVGVVTRGHGRNNIKNSFFLNDEGWKDAGDEAIILKNNLDLSIPIYVSSDKVLAAKELSSFGCEVVVVDDGFQHRRLHRDIDILLLSPKNQEGKSLSMFPYGTLREPISCLKRSDIVISTKSNLSNNPSSLREDFVLDLNFKNEVLCSGASKTLGDIMNMKNILSLCAIGDPESFKKSLELINIRTTQHLSFQDHHPFSKKDVAAINKTIDDKKIDNIVCTEKDYVKLKDFKNFINAPLYAIVLEHSLGVQLENEILGRLN